MSTDAYPPLRFIDLGQMSYRDAFALQEAHHAEVLASRDSPTPESGRVLLVEHVPSVITVTRRPGAAGNLIASPELLARVGVEVCETDRGGDITYHGPGQLVVYPIVDLNFHRLKLHDYMRLLEASVIDTLGEFGVAGERDASATGVWVRTADDADEPAKVCAMGVRVRRWVTMHGLALNVAPDLEHFRFIVPCGLVGRPVTSLQAVLGNACPHMSVVKHRLVTSLSTRLQEHWKRDSNVVNAHERP